jgi:1-acyl-sn-glycerol-3-phosphate acyltransferase
MKRETLQSILAALLKAAAKINFYGTEHLPDTGGLIVVTNHMSRMDTLHLFINPARKDITALVADKYQKYPVFNWVLDTAGVVWLDRSKADFTAFRQAADRIKGGVSLGIAPEGTRSVTGQLLEGKPGTVLLAMKTQVPIVPVGISGTDTYFYKLKRLRRPEVSLNFGPAFDLPPVDRDNREESMRKLTDELMCRIAVLLPPRYWGYYKGHPRLEELLKEQGPAQVGVA